MSDTNYSTAMWLRHPKEESHMAQPLDATQVKYLNYSNYSKLAAGKFRDLFGGQFFFDRVTRVSRGNASP